MNKLAENIIRKKAAEYGSTVMRIKGRKKTPKLVQIRVACMREILINTDLSRAEVGTMFDNRDRTTVLRLLKNVKVLDVA